MAELLNNRILVCAMLSWFVAQIVKAILFACVNGRFNIERVFGDGGMPSGHSATVTAAALTALLDYGSGSPIFAIATLFAIVVMHDALGVRRETGKQAVVIEHLIEDLNKLSSNDYTPPEKLKLLVGHTPLQVAAGFLIGAAMALIFHFAL